MKPVSLLFLRAAIALMVMIWGLDRILEPQHAVGASDTFYGGLLTYPSLLPVLGGAQVIVAGRGVDPSWPAVRLV